MTLSLDQEQLFYTPLPGFFGADVVRYTNEDEFGGQPSGPRDVIVRRKCCGAAAPPGVYGSVPNDRPLTALVPGAGRTAAGVGPYFLPTDQGQAIEYVGGDAVIKFGANPWQFHSVPQDQAFRTYVNTVPEPSSAGLMGLMGVMCVMVATVWALSR